jgi:CheY-like chemotaxis protein
MSRMILLADDSITIQKIVNLTFTGEGIDVVTVGNGDAALKKIHEHRPSLVLADIFMPGKNGYEVCETIKNDPELNSIPVILLVGAFEPFDGHEAARVQADSHLTKPFEIKALISAVRTLIEAAEQQAAAKTEPEVATSDAFVEVEEIAEPVSAPALSLETIEEPIVAASSPVPQQEEAVQIAEPPVPIPSEVQGSKAVPAEGWASEVIPEETPEIFRPASSSEVPEQPAESADTTFAESRKMPLPMIEETDPLGLESAEDGFELAGLSSGSISDSKSMVVEIWEAAEVPPVGEPTLLTPEASAQPSREAESQREEGALSSEPLTESFFGTSATDQVVQETVPISTDQPLESIQDVPVMPSAPSSLPPLSVAWGETETAELVDLIAHKVVEKLSREVIEKIAWEVIPDMAVLMIKDQVESHFKTINDR